MQQLKEGGRGGEREGGGKSPIKPARVPPRTSTHASVFYASPDEATVPVRLLTKDSGFVRRMIALGLALPGSAVLDANSGSIVLSPGALTWKLRAPSHLYGTGTRGGRWGGGGG